MTEYEYFANNLCMIRKLYDSMIEDVDMVNMVNMENKCKYPVAASALGILCMYSQCIQVLTNYPCYQWTIIIYGQGAPCQYNLLTFIPFHQARMQDSWYKLSKVTTYDSLFKFQTVTPYDSWYNFQTVTTYNKLVQVLTVTTFDSL